MADTAPARKMPKKPTPIEAFELNMADAVWMVDLAEALDNRRKRSPYKPTREKLGQALKLSKADQDGMDILESDDFVVIIKRGSDVTRESLEDRTVLLRHAVVAACAATETYFADKLLEIVRPMLRTNHTASGELPPRLRNITLTLGALVDIDHRYTYRRRGLTETIVAPFIEERASVDPSVLGELFSLAGHRNVFKTIEQSLGWDKGWCERRMTEITKRRNVIAHTGDRKGRGRNTLEPDETRSMTDDLIAIVHEADKILTPAPKEPRRPERSEAVYLALTRCAEPVTAAELAELSGAPRTTVAGLLSTWCVDQDEEARFPHVERVARGLYRYNP
jgi:hypothetical protein